MKKQCHNYQPECEHRDCADCEDWWYEEADEDVTAWKGV